MQQKTINIIGAGRLGKTMGKLITQHNAGIVQAVCNSTIDRAERAIQFIGQGKIIDKISALPSADITFITVPDDKIKALCEQFVEQVKANDNSIVVHCSGSLTAKEVLSAAKKNGYQIASAHPIRSFADPVISVENYQGTYCAIEGDEIAVTTISSLFSAIGSIPFMINGDNNKKRYHAGLVFASNYLVGLSATATTLLREAGITDKNAMDIVLNLMQGTLNNLSISRSPSASLTGPLKRGDINTIENHQAALAHNPALLNLYDAFTKVLLNTNPLF